MVCASQTSSSAATANVYSRHGSVTLKMIVEMDQTNRTVATPMKSENAHRLSLLASRTTSVYLRVSIATDRLTAKMDPMNMDAVSRINIL